MRYGLASIPPLSPQQRRMLTFMAEFQRQHGRAPKHDCIAAELGMKYGPNVVYHMHRLEQMGVIRRHRHGQFWTVEILTDLPDEDVKRIAAELRALSDAELVRAFLSGGAP